MNPGNEHCFYIGGSAGSLDFILELLPILILPTGISLVIVLHRGTGGSQMSELFSYKTSIPIFDIEDKMEMKGGHIYIAPADYHLLLEEDRHFALDFSEKINYSRPSIDVAFQSAARILGPRLTAVLLSGANSDGALGLKAVVAGGGQVWVQNPLAAVVPTMPQSAIKAGIKSMVSSPQDLLKLILAV